MDHNGWTLIVGLSGAFGLGMCFAMLGSIAVKMMPRMNLDSAKFGSMISAFMFACLIASLVVGTLQDRLGFQVVAIIGFVAAAVSVLILANAKDYNAGVIACVLLGVGAMACNTTGNVLGTAVVGQMLKNNPAAANNLVNVCFGLGLFLTPFVVSFLFQKLPYEKAVSVLGIILLVPILFTLPAKYPTAQGFTLASAFALLRQPVTIVAALVLFCYIALESSFTNWLAPFGKEVISKAQPGMPTAQLDASAARMLSAFAIAMMVGRLITGLTAITNAGGWLIAGSAVIAAIVILVMTGVSGSGAAFALAAISGLVFAPAFPTTVGVTFGKFGGGSGSLFGIIFAVGLLGAVIVPKAIGNMAKGASIQKALKLLLPACVVLAILAVVLHTLPNVAQAGETPVPAAPAAAETAPSPAATTEP